jgi:hypothetical protein
MSGQAELTEFGGILITIRSRKSYFEATKAIEDRLQRFSVPKLMEYATHADREGAEAYVDKVSSPSKPVRVCVSQRDGEETRIDQDQVTAFFSQFSETRPSDVPRLLDTEMVKVFEDAA